MDYLGYSNHNITLSVSYVRAIAHDKTHLADSPDNFLDNSHYDRSHEVVAL